MNLHEKAESATNEIISSKLVRAVKEEKITRTQYIAYISDVYTYARHSSQVIGLAANRLVLSHPELASYLYRHAVEELGHDKWAASDLVELGLTHGEIESIQPSSACLRMIALEYFYAAHSNPVGLFGWMFVLECLGGKIGGSVAISIDKALHLNNKGIYFLSGHGEADAQHSEDLITVISNSVTAIEDIAAFERMINESTELYRDILDAAFENRALQKTEKNLTISRLVSGPAEAHHGPLVSTAVPL